MFEPGAIREDRQLAAAASEVQIMCPHCHHKVFVPLGWQCSPTVRQEKIKAALDEHRGLCSGAPPEAYRVYSIEYPRK